jgi:glycosyltransferase involved in cell wall biosynthesis
MTDSVEEVPRSRPLDYAFDSGHVKHPVVSVVVTNYNYAAYIEACLASIAAQTYRHFQCVVVDDASTDRSVEAIERFVVGDVAAGQFRLVRHTDNEGQMVAFQTGLQHTDGSFVVFVDADDLLFPDFLETHLKAHLNSARPAAFTNSEQLQISADGQLLTGTQAMSGTPELRAGRSFEGHQWLFSPADRLQLRQTELPLQYYGPRIVAPDGWIWSTTSAAMFRRAVLGMVMSPESRCLRICADRYLFNFSHALGGSLIIRTVHGCYRRHASNAFSDNPVVGGESFLGDNRKDPSNEANALIFQHVLGHRDRFCRLVGRDSTVWLLRHFGPVGMLTKVMLAARTWYRSRTASASPAPAIAPVRDSSV